METFFTKNGTPRTEGNEMTVLLLKTEQNWTEWND